MKKKLLLSVLLIIIMSSILALNAFASETYNYADNMSAGSPVTTLLTENDANTKTWTLYPSITLNDSGVLSVSGTGVSVTYSNYSSYKGYFYEQGGKLYQFDGCSYVAGSQYIEQGTECTVQYSKWMNPDKPYSWAFGYCCALSINGSGYIQPASGTGTISFNEISSSPQYTNKFITDVGSIFRLSHKQERSADYGYYYDFYGYSEFVKTIPSTYSWGFRELPTIVMTFDPQSGNVSPATSTVIYNRTYSILPTPTRAGYTFNGWFTGMGSTGTRILGSSTVSIASNATLYASWTVNTYTVTFDPQSGSVTPSSIVATYDSNYGTLPTPTRTGYSFNGWYTGIGGTGTQILVTSKVSITSNSTLYASWIANTYTVTFAPLEGTVSTTSMSVTFDSPYGSLPTPTRIGYNFNGWYTELNDGGTQILSTSAVNITSNTTLYASWSIIQYTVSFESNGGSSVASIKQDDYTAVNKPADPTKIGYTFTGWYTDSTLSNAVTWPISLNGNDITLYATWIINQYTVSFNSNGGSSEAPIKQDYNTTVAKPTDPTRIGYTFVGWYMDSALTSAVTWPLTIGASDVAIYAAWTINQYTVSFDSNGGSSEASIMQDYNSTVAEPAAPTLTGYTFAGWYTDLALTSAVTWPLTIGASDVTLYAAWTINQYTVSFDSNSGSSVASIKQDYNTTVAEPVAPTLTGYTFAGWHTDSDLASAVSWPMTIGVGDITLYAKWTINPYTVSFDSNGGSSVPSAIQDFGTTVAEPAAPTCRGYTFAGWCSDLDLKSAVSWPMTIGAGDITLYAAWTPKPYTVSFECNEGSSVTSIIRGYGTTVTEPEKPARSGYTFAGWYTDSELKNTVNWPLTIGASDVTLYAKWTVNTGPDITWTPNYTVSFDTNGGGTVINQSIASGEHISAPPEPTRVGYTFEGWYKDSACSIPWDSSEKVTGSITLFAKWSAAAQQKTYTVTFESNGGNVLSSQTVYKGETILPVSAPTKNGYSFTGWYKDASLTAPWNFAADIVTNNMTLYAKWDVAEENKNASDKPKKGNSIPTAVVSSSTDDGDADTDTRPSDSHGGRDPGEMDIPCVKEPDNLVSENATDTEVTKSHSWSELLRFAGPIAAAVLVLLIGALLTALIIQNRRRKRVDFYDNSGEVCTAAIRRNKVDITKAISKASGRLLKVKISDWYMEKAYGSELEFCYNGASIGTVTIDDEDSFDIDIR